MVGRSAGALGAIGMIASLAGCGADPFVCSSNGQCLEGGAQGICQPSGVCSFDDDDCESGQRFGEHAGALANMCVPVGDGTSTGAPVDDTVGASETTAAIGEADSTSAGGRDESTSDDGDSTTTGATSTTSTTSTTGAETATTEDGLPNGSECSEPSQCGSGHCFLLGPLGGICGECTTDADCRYGCGTANPLVDPPLPSTCDDGMLGAGCSDDLACLDGLVCSSVVEVPGIVDVGTCGTCGVDVGCAPDEACTLVADYNQLQGQHDCVPAGSTPDGMSCSLQFDGESACANHCEAVTVMGLLEIGICGECLADDDCMGLGETCVSGSFNLGEPPQPSQCN